MNVLVATFTNRPWSQCSGAASLLLKGTHTHKHWGPLKRIRKLLPLRAEGRYRTILHK